MYRCEKCGKKLGGFRQAGFDILLEDHEATVCKQCFEELKKEYETRETCQRCYYFNRRLCKKTGLELTCTDIDFQDYFPQAEDCVYFITKRNYEKKVLRGEAMSAEGEKQVKEKEIIREKEVIVKIKCPYCGKLYNETFDACPHCGGKR
jgi:hypothetical protein